MDIFTKATEAPENVHKNVDISTKATEATEAPQNVHKNRDISIEATEAPENVNKNVDISIKASEASEAPKVFTKVWTFQTGLLRPPRPPQYSKKMWTFPPRSLRPLMPSKISTIMWTFQPRPALSPPSHLGSQYVHKNVDISNLANKAIKAPQNVQRHVDIYTKATMAH